ncbi:MAG: HEAT repeat domain-containing protein, partial [Calditrichia bacterium]|nr:HEAT repeat domain-containing protein [Calditrichia bacterium]
NKPFLLNNKSGKGKVFLTVGHPENTPGMRWIVPRMARWAAGKELIRYSPLVVKPERDSAEVLFDENLRKKESELYSNLIFGNSQEKLKAINKLVEIRSWGAKERITGLLRDNDPEVRLSAAQAIVELEHTAAIKDLQSIYLWEKDLKYKNEFKKFYKQLAGMCYTLDD